MVPANATKNMKPRQSFIDVPKRTVAAFTATAMFEFQFNLASLAARDADPAVNDLVDPFYVVNQSQWNLLPMG
jgi:hypothetical protein